MEQLLQEIAGFLDRTGLSEREFGIRALNDHKFISDLRGEGRETPRSPSLRTVDKVRSFMRDFEHERAAA